VGRSCGPDHIPAIYEQVERQLWGVRTASILRSEFLDKLERALRRQ
jgi:hypothetical protein